MNTRCRPGDLALVLRGLYTGSVVTVIELADEELLNEIGVADNSRPCWVTDKPLDWGPHDEFRWTLAPDTSLMPIRPEPDPLDEEPMYDLSDDIGHFHQLVASGQLADFLYRIAGRMLNTDHEKISLPYAPDSEPLPIEPQPEASEGESEKCKRKEGRRMISDLASATS